MYKALLLLAALAWGSQVQSKELIACIDDHPPYQIIAEDPYGIHISALKVLAEELDRQLTYVKSPNFARCVALLKQGQVDVIAGLGSTTERDKFAFYAPFKAADALRVLSKNGITIKSYDDLYGKIIGVGRGSTYFPRFDKDNKLNKVTIQNMRIGFSMLMKERIDLIMVSPATITTFSKEISDIKLNVSPIELEDMRNKETAFGFSKQHKLGLSDQEIINTVMTAYKQGRFK